VTARARRATRGLAAASVAVVLAAISHTVAGGAAPAPWLVATAIGIAWPIATLCAGGRVRLPGQVTAVAAAQVLLHALFSITASATGHAHSAGGHMHGMDALALPLSPTGSDTLSTVAPGPLMVIAHVLAGIAALVLVRHGEAAARAVLAWATTALRAPLPVALPQPTPLRTCTPAPAPPRTIVVPGPLRRRGPPPLSR